MYDNVALCQYRSVKSKNKSRGMQRALTVNFPLVNRRGTISGGGWGYHLVGLPVRKEFSYQSNKGDRLLT